MKTVLALLRSWSVVCSLLISASLADTARAEHAVPRDTRRPNVEPEVFQIEDNNPAMQAAVRQARRTLGTFVQALRSPRPGQTLFAVKKPLYQKGQVEHLWLAEVTFSGNRFHGRVDNRPRKIHGLHPGDRLSVNPDEISDWAYVDHGQLVGGYTIRALYRQLSPERKQELQNEVVFRIPSR